jgi:SAM-dependent methyltransferase
MSSTTRRGSLATLVCRAHLVCLFAAAVPASLACQQVDTPSRTPDVHFVPTDPAVVRGMLGAAQVRSNDVVYDLGCGDGRFVITAVKQYGARGVCVDIDPVRIAESRRNADTAGVARRITFHEGDLFEMDLSDATVVTLYLLPNLNERLRPKLFRELRPGARVVSNAFDMGDWEADSLLKMNKNESFPAYAYYWVMPADVSGTWNLTIGGAKPAGEHDYRLKMDQRYQKITGAGWAGDREVPVTNERLTGDRLRFTIRDSVQGRPGTLQFSGRVTGDKATGTVRDGAGGSPRSWSAVRAERGRRSELETNEAAGASMR